MFADPLVEETAVPNIPKLKHWDVQSLRAFDLIVVVMRQQGLDFELLRELEGVCVEWWCQ